MESKQLIEGEEILIESNDKTVTLTNYRIRYYIARFGKASLTSIVLDKVSSVEMRYKSYMLFLYIGVIVIIASIFLNVQGNNQDAVFPGIIIGALLILIYWLTRKHVVTISSDGGAKINIHTKGMKSEDHVSFINKIEAAKHKMFQLGIEKH